MDSNDLLKRLADDNIQNFWIVYHDYSGRACAKTLPPPRFKQAVEGGIVFARANLDFAVNDHNPADALFTPDTGDFMAVPDPNTYRKLPYLPNTALAHVFMLTEDYEPFDGCPRTALANMVEQYAAQDMSLTAAFEPEFSLFNKIGDGEYEPSNFDGMYTLAGLNRHADLIHQMIATLEEMGISVEQLGKEYGPSQYEMSIKYGSPLQAADDYLVMKEVVRALALRVGMIASYMPKPYDHLPGNGLHVNLAVWDGAGETNLTGGSDADHPLAETGLLFVGGLLNHAPGLTGVGAPTVNSYKRLLPGSWAPAHISWGVGNRAGLIRVPDTNRRARVEYRSGDPTANPFLYLTALMAAGLDGINNKIDPGAPISDLDVGHASQAELSAHDVRMLPRTLPEALAAFESDEVLTAPLSPVLAQEFLKVKRFELELYNIAVHRWERQMYMETP
jgi:glutamine synthetase